MPHQCLEVLAAANGGNKEIKIPTVSENALNILGIDEDSVYSYDILERFYKRIKDFPTAFLGDLASAIHDELYEFDETKLKLLSQFFAERMDETTMREFVRLLTSLY